MEENLILTVNAGSTSARLGLFDGGGAGAPRRLQVRRLEARPGGEGRALQAFLAEQAADPALVVHRVVHAGPWLRETRPFDAEVATAIERHAPLAPLHNPPALAWWKAAGQQLPRARALAVFDSGFYRQLPEVAARYALPRDLCHRLGLRRLGFHGLAHQSMFRSFTALGPRRTRRVVSLQLGGGCSATALLDGQPVETSMGFSPLEGLVMATRPGDVDPGVLVTLMSEGHDAGELWAVLNEDAGLRGLSGGTSDLRELLASDTADARLAVDVYCHRVRKYLGAYTAVLGGLDAVLVGGGAGEGAPALRARLFTGLEALGLALDEAANAAARPPARIDAGKDAGRAAEIWVIPTDEEQLLAEEALALVAPEQTGGPA
jgi:acetate kinase